MKISKKIISYLKEGGADFFLSVPCKLLANMILILDSLINNKRIEKDDKIEGQVVKGTIISIEKEMINIDVGYKAEGRINIREFIGKNKSATL